MVIIYLILSLAASLVGAISGIGGGIIIKPVLDSLGSFSVSTISFLSGCTVLSMSAVTLIRSRKSEVVLDRTVSTLLATGGIIGGIIGKKLFDIVKNSFENDAIIGSTQSILLIIMTLGVLIFTIKKDQIKPRHKEGKIITLFTGLMLGSIAAFLGIGGGPINLAILYFFFSMDSKTAALSSIYVIFLSQLTSLIFTFTSGNVPAFDYKVLILMICGGIIGGITGSHVSKKLSHKGVDKLFIGVLTVIIMICFYNLIKWIV